MTGNVLDIPVKTADGRETALNEYKRRVLLIVNVASKCGLTPQYEGLEKLYSEKRGRGFVVAAFPANDFKGQEPGTDARSSISAPAPMMSPSRSSRRSRSRARPSTRFTGS